MTNPNEDAWAWVEVALGEPGLYAYQSLPQIAAEQTPEIVINTFHTEASDITGAFLTNINEIRFPVTGYPADIGRFSDGIGNWGANKNHIVWLYDDDPDVESVYVAVADTSARPIPNPPDPLLFFEDLFFFYITGEDLHNARLCRSVPPDSEQITFLASTEESYLAGFNLYFIPSTGTPSIVQTVTPSDLHAGAHSISYYSFSGDGLWMAAQVDDRLIVYDRIGASVELDVIERYSHGAYQFSEDGEVLYYTKDGVLYLRRKSLAWAVEETVVETDTYECKGDQLTFTWNYPRLSPDNRYWVNIFSGGCGGAFDFAYRSFLRFFDASFFLLAEDNFSFFASHAFIGDYSNDSRWYLGGDGNINGNSLAIAGPSPGWDLTFQGSTSTGFQQMRSFQAW